MFLTQLLYRYQFKLKRQIITQLINQLAVFYSDGFTYSCSRKQIGFVMLLFVIPAVIWDKTYLSAMRLTNVPDISKFNSRNVIHISWNNDINLIRSSSNLEVPSVRYIILSFRPEWFVFYVVVEFILTIDCLWTQISNSFPLKIILFIASLSL